MKTKELGSEVNNMQKIVHSIKTAHMLCGLSFLAALLAAVVFFTAMDELWGLAGTQWLLVSIALGVFSSNMHMCKDCAK